MVTFYLMVEFGHDDTDDSACAPTMVKEQQNVAQSVKLWYEEALQS